MNYLKFLNLLLIFFSSSYLSALEGDYFYCPQKGPGLEPALTLRLRTGILQFPARNPEVTYHSTQSVDTEILGTRFLPLEKLDSWQWPKSVEIIRKASGKVDVCVFSEGLENLQNPPQQDPCQYQTTDADFIVLRENYGLWGDRQHLCTSHKLQSQSPWRDRYHIDPSTVTPKSKF